MTIDPDQIQSWSERPGSFLPSWTRGVLSDALRRSGRLDQRRYEIVVQGSYANETNIRGDSDVDLIVEMKMPFEEQIEQLNGAERVRFEERYETSLYDWHDFREDILAALNERFWTHMGRKCIDIRDWDSMLRLPADVVPALEYREYFGFSGDREVYRSGVFFHDSSGRRIQSYPRQHLRNGRTKDRKTGGRYKEVIRVLKNARMHVDCASEHVENTSSYLIECLLYNVPESVFRRPLANATHSSIRWLVEHRDEWPEFMCQNEVFTVNQAFDESHLASAMIVASESHCS